MIFLNSFDGITILVKNLGSLFANFENLVVVMDNLKIKNVSDLEDYDVDLEQLNQFENADDKANYLYETLEPYTQ